MDWRYLLFSIEGRISRKPFWIAVLVLSAIELAAHFAIGEHWSSIFSLLLAYPEFALLAKRGHDRNVPAWIAGTIFAAASVLYLLDFFGVLESLERSSMLVYGVVVPLGIAALIVIIDFGFRRGTVGPNRYGPDPLKSQAGFPRTAA